MVFDRCHQMVTQIVPDSPRDIFPLLSYMTQGIISGFFFGDKNGSRCLLLDVQAQAEYAGGGILKAKGLCSATITSVEKILSGAPVPRSVKVVTEVSRAMRRLAAPRIECRRSVGGADMLEALCRTFRVNSFAEGSVPADTTSPGFERSTEYLLSLVESPSKPGPEDLTYLNRVADNVTGRSFFATREGHTGLALRVARAGNQICMLFGCRAPLLLRSDNHGNHTVVGECCIHRLMECEALPGPFPNSWQRVIR